MKEGKILAGSLLAAVAASLCCILPIAFAILGVSVVGISQVFASWRPYLLGVTGALLAAGFYFAYRPAKCACAPNSACAEPMAKRRGRRALWIAGALVLSFAAFPYFSGRVAGWVLPKSHGAALTAGAKTQETTLAIEGMDCPACAVAITHNLNRVPGVVSAQVDYPRSRAVVRYRIGEVTTGQLSAAVAAAGYRSHIQ